VKIVAADVIVTSPSRNFVTLKITTDDGVSGLGDATLNGRELAVAAYLKEHVAPLLIDRDPHRIEDTWQFMYRSAYWRRGPVTMAAIAAVDMALWDIKGKVANLPVYQLLGGPSRTVCAHMGTLRDGTYPNYSIPSATIANSATPPYASRARFPVSTRSTVSPRRRSPPVNVTTTNPPAAALFLSRKTGIPVPTYAICRRFSRQSGTSSDPTCRYYMMATIA
jgi:L-alanine-DL-glutamate epimerase-like enolase superfamily enzyme